MQADHGRRIKRLGWLLAVVVVLLAVRIIIAALPVRQGSRPHAETSSQQSAAAHPSIILISLDTLRPDHLGCYGYEKNTSPNLDNFASGAVRFTDVRCQAPWTLLSHMSLFTSRLPLHNGVDAVDSVLPADVPTLAELLGKKGYYTAGIVNNAQMQRRWGFSRGFKTWQELTAGPAGACNIVTDQALSWLCRQPPSPYFLFLHYFDAHGPYTRPPEFAQAMGSTLSARDIHTFLPAHRFLDDGPVDATQLQQIVGAYDGCINWMDHELGRLLVAIPPDVVVVIFSDHGEAFREHGFFAHGSTLFDEEVRTVLLVRLPGQEPRVIDTPVALLDVAPTLLALAGQASPMEFEGQGLLPLIRGESLPAGPIPAEIRMDMQRSALQSVVMGPWKAVVSLMDGSRQLYQLPDEVHNRAAESPQAAQPLFQFLEKWASERDYWVLYARGQHRYEINIQPREGVLMAVVPSDISHDGDHGDVPTATPTNVVWKPLPGDSIKMLHLQLSNPASALQLRVSVDGVPTPDALTPAPAPGSGSGSGAGAPSTSRPGTQPESGVAVWESNLGGRTFRPLLDQPAKLDHDGVLAVRYHGYHASGRAATRQGLDAETMERLRSLGYIR